MGGCFRTGQQQRLAWIWLQNQDADRYEVDLTVEDDGEIVFSDAYVLPPAVDAEMTDIRLTDPVEDPGHYTVTATIRGDPLEVDAAVSSDGGQDCVGVRFTIRDDGSTESAIEYPDGC